MQSRLTDFCEPRLAARAGTFLNEEYLLHNRPRSASSVARASHPVPNIPFSRLPARCRRFQGSARKDIARDVRGRSEARIARPGEVR